VEGHNIDKHLDGVLIKPITPSLLFDAIIQAKGDEASERSTDAALQSNHQRKLQGRVLLVEDNEINQIVAIELLIDIGIDVDVVSDGQQAVDFVMKKKPDLILMDIQMPIMDGYEATMHIRKIEGGENIPIYAMTANALVGDADKSIQAGMNGHIPKPVDPEHLFHVLSEHLSILKRDTSSTAGVIQKQNNYDKNNVLVFKVNKGIDLNQGLKHVGGNQVFYLRLLRDFVDNHGHCVAEINQSLLNSNYEDARREAHTLKGICGTIGASDLQKHASVIEVGLTKGELPDDELLALFKQTADTLFSTLKEVIAQADSSAVNDQLLNDVEKSHSNTDRPNLEDLYQALTLCDAKSGVIFSQIKSQLQQHIGKVQLEQLEKLINGYEFEDALKNIHELLDDDKHYGK
jgi:CheY-like chemotaxis protein